MIFTWTAEFIAAALTGLSDQQLAALDLAAGTAKRSETRCRPSESVWLPRSSGIRDGPAIWIS